jgi:cardiolipin synthase A/B
MTPSLWSREQLYFVMDDYFRDLVESINGAQASIEMETYIFEKGVLGDRITKALSEAAKRGVKVRLLIDGIGSPNFVRDYEPRFEEAGVRVRYYRMVPWIFRHISGEPKHLVLKFFYRLARLNKGNHRKMVLVDMRDLWIGSANISDVHLIEVNGDRAWKDLGVSVTGPETRIAKRAFDIAFSRGLSLRLEIRLPKLLVINQTYFQKKRQRAEQRSRLRRSKERIWIQTPYFVPLTRVALRLIRKAKAGVDVRIIVPGKSDMWFIPWMSYSYLQLLAANGVKVYEYPGGFVHQKLYLIDDWICLGSTNLNHRSYLHDLEIDVVITHPDNKISLEKEFAKDQSVSNLLGTETWASLPLWKRAVSWFASRFSYWA